MKNYLKELTPTLLIILAASALLFNSCKEDEDDGLNQTNWGYVKEYYTEKPIANAMIVLYGKTPKWAVQDTLYTDSNGRYEFGKVKYLAELQASAPNYIPNRMFTQDELVGRFNRTIFLYQPAEMVFHVKNVRPFNQSDRISLNDFFAPQVKLDGNKIDTMICCLLARRYVKAGFQMNVLRNGKDSLFVLYHTSMQAKNNIVEVNY